MLYKLKSYEVYSDTGFSSPEQRSRRAVVLPLASASALVSALASTNVNVFIKGFKTSLFPNLITDLIHLWYDHGYILAQNFAQYHPHYPRSCQSHRLRIFMLKFFVKVFRISFILN